MPDHEAQLLAVYEDVGVSGTPLEKRPGLLSALNALVRDRVLLVVRRDRLARDTLTAAMAERIAQNAGASIVTVGGEGNGDGPEAQLMRTILDAFAQYEKTLIVLRTKAGLARKRRRASAWAWCPTANSSPPIACISWTTPPNKRSLPPCARCGRVGSPIAPSPRSSIAAASRIAPAVGSGIRKSCASWTMWHERPSS